MNTGPIKVRCSICEQTLQAGHKLSIKLECNCKNVVIHSDLPKWKTVVADHPNLASVYDTEARHWFAMKRKQIAYY